MWAVNHFFSSDVIAATLDASVDFAYLRDDKRLTVPQWVYLENFLNIFDFPVVNLNQVHGNKVVVVEDMLRQGQVVIDADSVITQSYHQPMMIRTADCLPVFIFSDDVKAMGLVHAGWRGTQQNILAKTIEVLKNRYQSDPRYMKIAFGPAIQKCCYEVGDEFKTYFHAFVNERNGRWWFDNTECNRQQALDAGILKTNIKESNICTHCSADYFSYRRQKENAGRNLSVMMLTKVTM